MRASLELEDVRSREQFIPPTIGCSHGFCKFVTQLPLDEGTVRGRATTQGDTVTLTLGLKSMAALGLRSNENSPGAWLTRAGNISGEAGLLFAIRAVMPLRAAANVLSAVIP